MKIDVKRASEVSVLDDRLVNLPLARQPRDLLDKVVEREVSPHHIQKIEVLPPRAPTVPTE